MATIKSFTDLEQSKKLAEILPFKSADMQYISFRHNDDTIEWIPLLGTPSKYNIPCWSLASLLDALPNNENISTNLSKGGYRISTLEYTNNWFVEYEDETNGLNNCVTSADNPIDACYEMILKLKEKNLL
jgi:hypothetical protein